MLPSLAFLVSLALLAWGAINPPQIVIDTYENDNGLLGSAGLHSERQVCFIGIYGPAWRESLSDAQRASVITHEVGHCLGLGHYGDCNSLPSIMGCALGPLTEHDRLRYRLHTSASASRVTLPLLAVDP